MTVRSESRDRHPDATGPLRLIRDCSDVLATFSKGAAPWAELCRLLVEDVGLRYASLHVSAAPHDRAKMLAQAGEHDECAAVRDLAASEGMGLSPTRSRSAKLLVRTAHGEAGGVPRTGVRKRSFDCLLLPFEWEGRAVGVLHIHSPPDSPVSPEIEAALGVLTHLLAWRVASQAAPGAQPAAGPAPSSRDASALPQVSPATILAGIPDVVTQTSRDGFLMFVSPSVSPVLGYGPEELVGKSLLDLVHPDDTAAVSDALRTAEGPSTLLEYRARHAEGHWVDIEAAMTRLGACAAHGECVIATHRHRTRTATATRSSLPPTLRETSDEDTPAAPARRRTVLVVDDEALVREVITRMLDGSGFTVLTAVDGQDALGIWEREGGEIDVVITDLLMPGMPGTEVLERLEALRPGLAGVYMSGFPGTVRASFELDPRVPFLQKPFGADSLLAALESSIAAARETAFRR